MGPRYRLLPLALFIIAGASCSEEGPHRKETYPVTGRVTVDGNVPDSPIQVTCHSTMGIDQEHPTFSASMTGTDGSFELSTYETGDGVPPGEYVLTFFWGKMNLVSMNYGGPDKLKDRYKDPEKSPVKFTVEPGKPTELGLIELKTE